MRHRLTLPLVGRMKAAHEKKGYFWGCLPYPKGITDLKKMNGAQNKIRTCTRVIALPPQGSVSTNFTTWAWSCKCNMKNQTDFKIQTEFCREIKDKKKPHLIKDEALKVIPQGFEPWTHTLKVYCSTSWAKRSTCFRFTGCKYTFEFIFHKAWEEKF